MTDALVELGYTPMASAPAPLTVLIVSPRFFDDASSNAFWAAAPPVWFR
ncbi:hypothetical protein [Cryptosporangium phraense]|nr:hypothetical protein [Cryptosporangium phraense]